MDISKLTLEQSEQIDPRQAQLWMLLKMHQVVKKVEDVHTSTEQLHNIYQASPLLSAQPSGSKDTKKLQPLYENTSIKRPVPIPRQRTSKCEDTVPAEDGTVIVEDGTAPMGGDKVPVEDGRAPVGEGTVPVKRVGAASERKVDESQEALKKVTKLHRRQKMIGKL